MQTFELTGRAEESRQRAIAHYDQKRYDEALDVLYKALAISDGMEKIALTLTLAVVYRRMIRPHDGLDVLLDIAPRVEAAPYLNLKAKHLSGLGAVRATIAGQENKPELFDQAIIDYTGAGIYHQQTGDALSYADTENNIAIIKIGQGRADEAHEHLDRAEEVFRGRDDARLGQLEETRARALIAQRSYREALRHAALSVSLLTDHPDLLDESLATYDRAADAFKVETDYETRRIKAALYDAGGSPTRAARLLGIERQRLEYKINGNAELEAARSPKCRTRGVHVSR